MESSNERHYGSIKKALEGVGLTVDKIKKKGKKTVITIFRNEASDEITIEEEAKGENIKEVM